MGGLLGATPFSDGKNRFVVLQDNGIGGFLYGLALEKVHGEKPVNQQVIPIKASPYFIEGIKNAHTKNKKDVNVNLITNEGSKDLSKISKILEKSKQDLRKTATSFRIAKNFAIFRKQNLRKLLILIELNNI
jgi:hypothetical protein